MNAVIAALVDCMVRVPERAPHRYVVRTAATYASLVLLFLSLGASRAAAQEVIEYYGTDALGSVRVVFAPDGTVKSRTDYLPFGEEYGTSTSGGPLPKQRFAGGQRDAEEDLDYFQARSYQTRTGRFISVDPIYAGLFEPQRWNRYTYALSNPLKFVDTDGLHDDCATTECVTVTAPTPGGPGPGGVPNSPLPGSNGGGDGFSVGGVCTTCGSHPPSGGGNNGGGGNGNGDGGDTGNGGQNPTGNPPPPGAKPLPPKVQKTVDKAFQKLKTTKPSASCQANVLDKLPNFDAGQFDAYLNQGASFYDGTNSNVPIKGGIMGGQAGISYGNNPKLPQTVSASFMNPGVNAMTSVTTPNLTVYLRASSLDYSNGGDNLRNVSLLRHEALHGFTKMIDSQLQSAFGIPVTPASGNITTHIAQNCQ